MNWRIESHINDWSPSEAEVIGRLSQYAAWHMRECLEAEKCDLL